MLRKQLRKLINSIYGRRIPPRVQPSYKEPGLPEGAESYLRPDNSRLKELRDRYAACDGEVTDHLVWTDSHVNPDDVKYFRGDNAYVWQLRGQNNHALGYVLATYYAKAIDDLGLLDKLSEDEAFGNFTFKIDNRVVSRDLLDSIFEICFLEKHLKISSLRDLTVLDIGAGYGRLAHRMVSAFPDINYLCTDAVAVSTFISEYYLGFRGVGERARVVPLDEIEGALAEQRVDLALNIHSFSECRIPAIEWWLSLLERNRVEHIMIVPNAMEHGGKLLLNCDSHDFSGLFGKHGYRMIAKEPKYRDPVVQEYAMNPTHHYLFKLSH